MREIHGDIWDYYDQGNWIIITTNGTIRRNGEAVMGRGIALQAKQRFPDLPYKLGGWIRDFGNTVGIFPEERIVSFPVKRNWWEKADPGLIEASCRKLSQVFGFAGLEADEVYMVRPGCGNGQLDWKDVKPILEKYLDDRFVVVERGR